VHGTLALVVERIATIESNPHLYALQILRNKIGDHLRTRSRRLEQTLNVTDSDEFEKAGTAGEAILADPEATSFQTRIETLEIVERIRQAIHKLSPICQALFLALLEGRTINEVWELTESTEPKLSRSTFDKRLFDCRKRLRTLVGEIA
jgi:DNA-directed RNA polymerase specialized sigma24 family protein